MTLRMTPKEYQDFLAKSPKAAQALSAQAPPVTELPPKYWNVKVYVFADGTVSEDKKLTGHGKIVEKYDSRREYYRSIELGLLQRAKKISGLERQKKLLILPEFASGEETIKAIYYLADFFYKLPDGTEVVEDVKGFDVQTGKYRSTEAFKIKWKLLKYKYRQYRFVLY
ncbi:MAG: DUF1064 domain-containing protein [Lachnospiraceae bacterium]|nr:DUF1064 domain-containing protein [Lachnospiraceae bacterium]